MTDIDKMLTRVQRAKLEFLQDTGGDLDKCAEIEGVILIVRMTDGDVAKIDPYGRVVWVVDEQEQDND